MKQISEPYKERSKIIVLAITGASNAIFGIRTIEILSKLHIETHLIISRPADITIRTETPYQPSDVKKMVKHSYDPEDMSAPIASGSFHTDGMLVLPCSIKTLSAIANSFTDNLVSRAADVCLKEGRKLLLGIRETPLHKGHIRLMNDASEAGAILFPLIPSFYGKPETLTDLIDNLIGRMLARMGIDNPYYHRWEGIDNS